MSKGLSDREVNQMFKSKTTGNYIKAYGGCLCKDQLSSINPDNKIWVREPR